MDEDNDIEPILQKIWQYLERTKLYVRSCPPFEKGKWEKGELESFSLDIQAIDRIYHYEYQDYTFRIKHYSLYGRTVYKARYLYFRLLFVQEVLSDRIGGKIFVTYDAQVYLKTVGARASGPERILQKMTDDGLEVEEPTEFDMNYPLNWRTCDLSLKLQCCLAIYDCRDLLRHYSEVLPCVLAKEIEQFIKVQGTVEGLEKELGMCVLGWLNSSIIRLTFPQT